MNLEHKTIEKVPHYILNTFKNWAIHYIDDNVQQIKRNRNENKNENKTNFPDICVKIEIQAQSKDETSLLSEIPYKCPGSLRFIKSTWCTRRVHQNINNQKDKYCVQFFCEEFSETKSDQISIRNDPMIHLYLKMQIQNDSIYGFIVDQNDQIWSPQQLSCIFPFKEIEFLQVPTSSPLCFVWHDKNDTKNKLWTINNIM